MLTKIRKQMTTIIWIFAIFFGISIFYMFGTGQLSGSKDQPKEKKETKYVMKINGHKIPMSQFYYEYTELKRMYEMAGYPSMNTYVMDMRMKVMAGRQLMMQEMLLQEAKKRNEHRISSGEVNKAIRQQRDATVGPADGAKDPGIPSRVKSFFSSNQKTKEFRDVLMRRGVSFGMFKQSIERRLVAEKIAKALGNEMQVKENKKVLERANSAYKKIGAGEPFMKLAAQYSDDPATKDNGGLWGWKTRADLDKAISDLAFNMPIGSYSEPTKTQTGYEIIKIEAREEATGPKYEAERPAIVAQLKKSAKAFSERDVKHAYEKVLLSHILLQVKDPNTLANEWLQKQIEEKKVKFEVLDPEIKAFWEMQDLLSKPKYGQKELDRIIGLYQTAIKSDKGNYNLYSQIGMLYEQKNKLLSEETGGKKAPDPYEKGGDVPKTDKFLKESLESYQKSYDMAQTTKAPEAETILGLARVNMAFYKMGKGNTKKYRKDAIQYYREAIDFSYDNIMGLFQIQQALTELKDKKGVKEVEQVMSDLQQQEAENQGATSAPMNFKVEDEAETAPAAEEAAPAKTEEGSPAAAPAEGAAPKVIGVTPAQKIKVQGAKEAAKPAADKTPPAKAPAPVAASGTR